MVVHVGYILNYCFALFDLGTSRFLLGGVGLQNGREGASEV